MLRVAKASTATRSLGTRRWRCSGRSRNSRPKNLVGVRGFEPPTPASRTQYSTRLSYTPTATLLLRLHGCTCRKDPIRTIATSNATCDAKVANCSRLSSIGRQAAIDRIAAPARFGLGLPRGRNRARRCAGSPPETRRNSREPALADRPAHERRLLGAAMLASHRSAAASACPRRGRRPGSCRSRLVARVVEHVVDQLERGAQMHAVGRHALPRSRLRRPRIAPRRAAASNSFAVLRRITSQVACSSTSGSGSSSAAAPRPRRWCSSLRRAPASRACLPPRPSSGTRANRGNRRPAPLAALPNSAFAVALPAAQLRRVDHVVVQQRGGVDELDHRGELIMVLAACSRTRRPTG